MKTLISEEQLREGIGRLADEIRRHYADKPLTLVGVLVGSIVLLADFIRLLDIPFRVGLVQSRGHARGTVRPGPLAVDPELLVSGVRGRHVLLVDDIFHSGETVWDLIPQLDELGPETIRLAVLLRKEGQCRVPKQPDFVGFNIPNAFVVGYGLDYEDRFRHLPYIAMLEPQETGGSTPHV